MLEPTVISVGRGTAIQFQIYGHPDFPKTDFSFTPESNFGSKNPKHKGQICYGENLTQVKSPNKLELRWLLNAYKHFPQKDSFFLKGFERIVGVSSLRKQIEEGENELRLFPDLKRNAIGESYFLLDERAMIRNDKNVLIGLNAFEQTILKEYEIRLRPRPLHPSMRFLKTVRKQVKQLKMKASLL